MLAGFQSICTFQLKFKPSHYNITYQYCNCNQHNPDGPLQPPSDPSPTTDQASGDSRRFSTSPSNSSASTAPIAHSQSSIPQCLPCPSTLGNSTSTMLTNNLYTINPAVNNASSSAQGSAINIISESVVPVPHSPPLHRRHRWSCGLFNRGRGSTSDKYNQPKTHTPAAVTPNINPPNHPIGQPTSDTDVSPRNNGSKVRHPHNKKHSVFSCFK